MNGKERAGICFMLAAVPIGILWVYLEAYRPELRPDPIMMRWIWGTCAAVMFAAMAYTKTLIKGGIGGTFLVMIMGPFAVLTVLFWGIWHKISPVDKEVQRGERNTAG